ncbi:MAG: dTMP kinase [Candidatus Omnitrophica bacterium]|nr:dTMP kinase [Candidatus Omnitrophota bacterium]
MAKKSLRKGIFITFEGGEGCGKTTQSKLLYDYLMKRGYACVYTREPGGTAAGELIRQVLLHSKDTHITDLAELFLFEASRAQIVEEVIIPALKDKRIVICDRFNDATFSYQGYGGKVALGAIKSLDDIATLGLKPDLTILLDIDTLTGLERARSKGTDRMEKKDVAYHKRVRSGYLKLAAKEPKRIKVVKVRGAISQTQDIVRREVEVVIRKYKRAG